MIITKDIVELAKALKVQVENKEISKESALRFYKKYLRSKKAIQEKNEANEFVNECYLLTFKAQKAA